MRNRHDCPVCGFAVQDWDTTDPARNAHAHGVMCVACTNAAAAQQQPNDPDPYGMRKECEGLIVPRPQYGPWRRRGWCSGAEGGWC